MSYDLYLKPRNGALDVEKVKAWFAGRPNWRANGDGFFYESEDTGVYFMFGFESVESDPEDEEEEFFPLSFNLNYHRPSFFGLEAVAEVRALTEAFDLIVRDPQLDDIVGDFSSDAFISGWNAGNLFAVKAMATRVPDRELPTLGTAQLEETWRWNVERAKLAEEQGDKYWVPKISFANFQGHVRSFCVWPDGCPSILPTTDFVAIFRTDYAPRRWFRKTQDIVFVEWDRVLPILSRHGAARDNCSWEFPPTKPPKDVIKFLQNLVPNTGEFEGINPDGILNEELVGEAERSPLTKPLKITEH